MSLPNEILPVGFLSSSGTEEPYLIERSLRFNSGDSSYLSRHPGIGRQQEDVYVFVLV